MGGACETAAPATVANGKGTKIGSVRIHLNAGEVHFHGDANGLKVAVPLKEWAAAWSRLSDLDPADEETFNYHDTANGTELYVEVNSDLDGACTAGIVISKNQHDIAFNALDAFTRKVAP